MSESLPTKRDAATLTPEEIRAVIAKTLEALAGPIEAFQTVQAMPQENNIAVNDPVGQARTALFEATAFQLEKQGFIIKLPDDACSLPPGSPEMDTLRGIMRNNSSLLLMPVLQEAGAFQAAEPRIHPTTIAAHNTQIVTKH